ncbi:MULTISPECIES: PQQ-dependent sugar dehydrogenase [Sphingobium]|uniref:Dehydrogenase n=1 Tax=Sphingobium fuliginis (strain ATCC 27551) TaxID=336203 RepID=A0ABQ1EZN2_SPHSA|nr:MULTISPECIES: PQQ-dependent sugar dehydrogenase [Sphingobium]AJR24989.1 dehydrogenase [Sphingobium sp. YBL2]RYL97696.1 PQQ-dependent sugar dehydrogenase [Sphingobium fuliginis]WDA37194.1 PQQ-dependent sugar dehydrogenase [Sphingobium sp. YC-XJ3]GFZ93623.1 dehydrogenase [Sphingobium fuliginis]
MRHLALTALPLALIACSADDAVGQNSAASAAKPFRTSVIADFDAPWAMTFLPDGRMLVTEKAGEMILFDPKNGTKIPVAGIPPVDSAGQGALMDVVPAPDFARSGTVYFSFSEAGQGGKGVALATGVFNQASDGTTKLDGVKVIFRASPYVDGNGHYSGRIAFSPDGKHLFFTNGERQKFDPAQDPKSTLGKVLRLNLDGTPAAGNPLAAKGFHPAVWSYGHRNLLGIAFDKDGRLWEQEMGPKGGDEVNLIRPGLNYGYPLASNGSHYDGRDIPDHKAGDGFEAPKVWWNPVISPAGLVYYSGDLFPQWKDSLFIGGLSSEALVRVKLEGEKASKADQWDMGARIREVEQGPDGALWLLEDGGQGSQGRLLKLTPAV